MEYELQRPPRLRDVIALYVASIVFIVLATAFPSTPVWATAILGFIGFGFLFFAFFAFYNWMRYTVTIRTKERNEANAITPLTVTYDKLSNLRSDQTIIAPRMTYNAEIDVVPGEEMGPRYFLRTPYASIPWEFVLDFFRNSGVVRLCPIGHYKDGSNKFSPIQEDREYARLLTMWLVVECLANEAPPNSGPNPATWVNKDCRQRALMKLGITLEMLWPDKDKDKEKELKE